MLLVRCARQVKQLERRGFEGQAAGYPFLHDSDDVYGGFLDTVDADLREALEIKTYYEQRWLEEGKNIHFMEIVPPSL